MAKRYLVEWSCEQEWAVRDWCGQDDVYVVLASDYDAQVDAGMKLFEENEQLRRDKARDQLVLRDITARAEQLAAEVRQWRMCVFQDENKPFNYKTLEWLTLREQASK